MIRNFLFVSASLFCLSFNCTTNNQLVISSNDSELSVAFYNIDNLFDTIKSQSHNDDDFTPNGKYLWNSLKYKHKLIHLQRVIDTLVDGHAPDVLGVCEIENLMVFKDLMDSNKLNAIYTLVHFDSPDERGIDVALALNSKKLSVVKAQKIPVQLSLDKNDKTRDILYVNAKSTIYNDTFHFFVCHFPSRREGKEASEQNRLDAAATLRNFIANNHLENKSVVIMGDFNDQPWDKSMTSVLGAYSKEKCQDCHLINLLFNLPHGEGSYKFKGHWERLDQIILDKSLMDGRGTDYLNGSLKVLNFDWMMQKGEYKGYPLRTFGGNKWLDGYSDHLPVCIKIALK